MRSYFVMDPVHAVGELSYRVKHDADSLSSFIRYHSGRAHWHVRQPASGGLGLQQYHWRGLQCNRDRGREEALLWSLG